MDTSFTFVTALTPATGKTKGAPKFTKLSSEKWKGAKSKPIKTSSNHGETKESKTLNQNKITMDSFSSCSSLITNDSSISLKSCSESLHFSSDRSFGDHDEKKSTLKPVSSQMKTSGQTTFKKIIQEVHAGLEKITFRKKRLPVADAANKSRESDYHECLDHISNINIDEKEDVKLSTPINNCDKIKTDEIESRSTEELNKLGDDLHNLSLEKIKTTRTKKSKSKPNKKLFSSISEDKNNSSAIDVISGASAASQDSKKNPLLASDSSTINLDDISPILRISVAPVNNFYADNDDFLSPKNISKRQTTKANGNKIEIPDKVELKMLPKKEKKSVKPTKAKDNKKNTKVLSELNNLEENECNPKETKIKGILKENPSRSQTKKPRKKKDSFVVSDTSSIEGESVSVYHKFISENIKFDVIKTTTPRSKYKKNSIFHDDGIFTPFVIPGKRSSSESEVEDDCDELRNSKKSRLNSSDEEDIYISNVRKTIFSSSSSLSSNEENKPPPSSNAELPKISVKKKEKKIQPKKNIKPKKFIQRDSSFDSPTKSPKGDLCIDLTSSPSFTPGSSTKANKITPITFKLKNLNKLTPARIFNPEKEPLSFLKSLSTLTSPNSIHPDAEQYRKSFKKLKEQLANKLFVLFNREVFENKLPEDLKIEWNPRMRSSSGLCYNKRVKTIIGPNKECLRVSRIALSTKIIESPERLRDTLIHELCHAAAWIIDNKADGHGPIWKSWARKAMRRFPELPPIRRCHDYSVQTKFKYKCVNCGYTIGRHSKSLNLDRKRCGYCYGRFELQINTTKKTTVSGTSPKSVQVKPLSKFALFVKENYGKIKSENSEMKHGDVMKMLSKNFALTKN